MQSSRRWPGPCALAGAAAMAAMLCFIVIALGVASGAAGNVDRAVLDALRAPGEPARPLGPAWLATGLRDLTALGSPTVLGLVVLLTVAGLLLTGRRGPALFALLATASGGVLLTVLKHAFERPRPDLFPRAEAVSSTSFPSGHALLAALVYLTLGTLLARLAPHRRLRPLILGTALLLTGLIGVSRVYLGMHWPTDVLAGWMAGAGWALGAWCLCEGVCPTKDRP